MAPAKQSSKHSKGKELVIELGEENHPSLRPLPHPAPPLHRLPRGRRRVRCPVARRQPPHPPHPPPPLLAGPSTPHFSPSPGNKVAKLLIIRRAFWLQMCVFLCMGGNSTTWMNTAVLVTCFRNFRKNRGPISGILKGYIGLSTTIFTDLCTALFSSSPAPFLLMLALVPAAVCTLAMPFLRESPAPAADADADDGQNEESCYFAAFNAVAVVVAVYLLLFDVSGDHRIGLSRAFSGGLLLLLASPLAVPMYAVAKSHRARLVAWSDLEARIREPPRFANSDCFLYL